jgi:alkylhydroperoxidase/carboxymuconolactone decarboxylase family protein YurZ
VPEQTDSEAPVLETVLAMTEASIERCQLPVDQLMLLRIAALAAVDAGPLSYLLHVEPALEAGVTVDDVQNALVAIAPIIGTPRVMSAAMNIRETLGFVIAVAVEEALEEAEEAEAEAEAAGDL